MREVVRTTSIATKGGGKRQVHMTSKSKGEKTVGTEVAVATPAVEDEGVGFDEDVEFDDNKLEQSALYRDASATVEILCRQGGKFFLYKEHYDAGGVDASVQDCCDYWMDSESDPISQAEAEVWLEHHCGQRDRDEVNAKIADLDKGDGVGR